MKGLIHILICVLGESYTTLSNLLTIWKEMYSNLYLSTDSGNKKGSNEQSLGLMFLKAWISVLTLRC